MLAEMALSGCITAAFSETATARAGLLVVSILTASAGAGQTNSAKRIELYDFPEIRAVVDNCTKLGRGRRRHRLEIVWISHVGS